LIAVPEEVAIVIARPEEEGLESMQQKREKKPGERKGGAKKWGRVEARGEKMSHTKMIHTETSRVGPKKQGGLSLKP